MIFPYQGCISSIIIIMILYLNTPGLQNMIMNSNVLGITVNSFIVSWMRCSTHPLCPGRDG